MKDLFLLDPMVTFLNHGSFGACPRVVFETYQYWQLELERQPVEFLGRRIDGLLQEARAPLAALLHVEADNLFYVPNTTTGINGVARSLRLNTGDEILTTDHEYGAMDILWNFISGKTGAYYIQQAITVPVTSPEQVIEELWRGVTPRTKVIFLSHITAPTALILPVADICHRARAEGILTVIDGAHVPGHIDLDLSHIDADYYAGNCHKWLSAPKGSAFLYVRPDQQASLEPLVISWGWRPEANMITHNEWQGTRDPSAYLSVSAAIQFQQEHDWKVVRARCHTMAKLVQTQLAKLVGTTPLAPDDEEYQWFGQMVSVPLPACDMVVLKQRLYDEFRVEVPLWDWHGQALMRVACQAYNTAEDIETLLHAVEVLLPQVRISR